MNVTIGGGAWGAQVIVGSQALPVNRRRATTGARAREDQDTTAVDGQDQQRGPALGRVAEEQEMPTADGGQRQDRGFGLGRRARLLIFGVTVALVSAASVGSTWAAFGWMETPEFCSACHVMQPERQAFERSPHSGIECAECHIAPGLSGLVKAKMDGTFQLIDLALNRYERPIPPPGHKLARTAVADNCKQCHREPPASQDQLLVHRTFKDDEPNSEQEVAFVLKLDQAPEDGQGRGIHWHVMSRVEFRHSDEDERQIDYVRVTEPSGAVHEYATLLGSLRKPSTDGEEGPQVASATDTMTCITCHNRVGHEFQSPDRVLDDALRRGEIDRTLPYVKREGLDLLTATYASTQEANAAIGELDGFYRDAYPDVYAAKQPQIERAIGVLRDRYQLVASPEMAATYETYPSFLGHRDTAGCFRCHDGKHFQIDEQGLATGAPIPSGCSTCHTTPTLTDPRQWSAPDWRGGPHPATMRFDHAEIIRSEQGAGRCALCHQRPFCAQCHQDDVLSSDHLSEPRQTAQGSPEPGETVQGAPQPADTAPGSRPSEVLPPPPGATTRRVATDPNTGS